MSRWTTRAATHDGAQFWIRPLRDDDRQRELAFLDTLSERTRYFRLFAPLKVLSTQQLDQLMDVDYDSRMAFVATIPRGEDEQFIAVARYAKTDREDTVELGVTVADAWQRRGVGYAVLTQLLRFARWRGYRLVTGMVLPENVGMIALAVSCGFETRHDAADHLVHIACALEDCAVVA